MEMIADQDVFILDEHFLEDGQLLTEDEFGQDRKQVFALDDMQLEIDEHSPIKTEIDQPTQDEPVASTSGIQNEGLSLNDDEREEMACFIEHIDIRSPIIMLRPLLEKRLGLDLSNHEYWLQKAQKLDPYKNLTDQCVQGEGMVQINVQLLNDNHGKRINIVDVLKPTEKYLKRLVEKELTDEKHAEWTVDNHFKRNLKKLQIPTYPALWTSDQVKHWIVWAVRQFNLTGIKLSDWNITGSELCEMTFDVFKSKCKNDKARIFWTHLELLRRCNFCAVLSKEMKRTPTTEQPAILVPSSQEKVKEVRTGPKRSRILGCNQSVTERKANNYSKSGTNGQIQLWQFLLELLTDKNHQSVIHWVSTDGQFKLEDPETVAQLWGERKHKSSMTYEKLSRALRYYYDGDMIAKVPGKRFVYQFVCDLRELLGYTALQLNNLVTECAIKNNLPVPSSK